MGAPGEPADGELVAGHEGQGPGIGHTQVEGADEAVDAAGGDNAARGVCAAGVLVPVVGEDLGGLRRGEGCGGGGAAGRGREEVAGGRRLVHGDVGDEVVLGGGGRPQVEEAQAAVGGDGGEQGGIARGEGDAVGAGADGESLEGLRAGWGPLEGVGRISRSRLVRGVGSTPGGGEIETGHTILTVPSHELDTKVSLVVWFQKTEKVSLLCSW